MHAASGLHLWVEAVWLPPLVHWLGIWMLGYGVQGDQCRQGLCWVHVMVCVGVHQDSQIFMKYLNRHQSPCNHHGKRWIKISGRQRRALQWNKLLKAPRHELCSASELHWPFMKHGSENNTLRNNTENKHLFCLFQWKNETTPSIY